MGRIVTSRMRHRGREAYRCPMAHSFSIAISWLWHRNMPPGRKRAAVSIGPSLVAGRHSLQRLVGPLHTAGIASGRARRVGTRATVSPP